MTRQTQILQETEWYPVEIEHIYGSIADNEWYEMRCLTEGLKDIYVTAQTESDLFEMMYFKLKCARLEREI
jgi:hypothetical protein